jgi:hypothetical protein
MSVDTFPDKHPESNRPYTIEWGDDLDAGETIVASDWEITGPDNTLIEGVNSISVDGKDSVVWLSGGTLAAQYKVKNRITTSSVPPRTIVAVKYINVREVPVCS